MVDLIKYNIKHNQLAYKNHLIVISRGYNHTINSFHIAVY